MTEYSVTIRLTADDFEHLSVMLSDRANFGLDQFPDRFADPAAGEAIPAAELEQWAYAYWLEDYPHVILARSYLEAIGEPFRLVSDESFEEPEKAHGLVHHTHSASWVIFTGYASPYWARRNR